ncbi:TPA: hypothetical protein ACH3X2_000617 [Trebouxia sp. C0005]
MGLADDITDRALQAHMADLKAAKEPSAEDTGRSLGSSPEIAPRSWARPSSRWAKPGRKVEIQDDFRQREGRDGVATPYH